MRIAMVAEISIGGLLSSFATVSMQIISIGFFRPNGH